MKKDEESELRCSKDNLNPYDEIRCRSLCHDYCIGCFKSNSPNSCTKCRYSDYRSDGKLICLETCPIGFEKNYTLKICSGFIHLKNLN